MRVNRIIIITITLTALCSGSFFFGVDYQKGKEATKEVKEKKAEESNHASDTKSLAKDSKKIASLEKQLADSLANVHTVDVSSPCPLREHERVYNEASRAVNSMRRPD